MVEERASFATKHGGMCDLLSSRPTQLTDNFVGGGFVVDGGQSLLLRFYLCPVVLDWGLQMIKIILCILSMIFHILYSWLPNCIQSGGAPNLNLSKLIFQARWLLPKAALPQ